MLAAPASAHHKHHRGPHVPGCRTVRCDRHIGYIWWKLNHPTEVVASWQGMSALEACIIQHESGGRPQAVNGIYKGIGQWEQAAWEEDGGLRYAGEPLEATYAQQEKVLRGEGEARMIQQQGRWDGCA